jgi:nicotinamidase-related amidase
MALTVPPPAQPGAGSAAFLAWLDEWFRALPSTTLQTVVAEAGGPERVAVLVVDLLVGFCSEGPLASPRVGALGPGAARFLTDCRAAGVRNLVVAADSHPEDSPEFASFPPHCIAGTREAEPIDDLAALPFFAEAFTVPKGSLSVGLEPAFAEWQAAHPEVRAWIILGDCTDLCVHQAATYLRLQANTQGKDVKVWVPANLVDTYDLPVETARRIGALPHDGDLMHRLFLYHMALNGVAVVREIAA